jgi:hypothetical protein
LYLVYQSAPVRWKLARSRLVAQRTHVVSAVAALIRDSCSMLAVLPTAAMVFSDFHFLATADVRLRPKRLGSCPHPIAARL